MKILIKYSSVSGNTEKVARYLGEKLGNADVLEVGEKASLNDYDLIIVGTWIRRATADPKAQNFIKEIKNKKVAFFFTLGAYPDTDYANNRCDTNIRELFNENNNEILGSWHCHGKISKELQEKIKKRGNNSGHVADDKRLQRWQDASTHPDEIDLVNAYKYFKNTIKKLD